MEKGLLIILLKRFVTTWRITLPKTIRAILGPTGIKQSRQFSNLFLKCYAIKTYLGDKGMKYHLLCPPQYKDKAIRITGHFKDFTHSLTVFSSLNSTK